MLLEYINSSPKIIVGIMLAVGAVINAWHAGKQQDKAFDMPANSDTERICRQIRLLETRIWVIGFWVVFSIGLIIIFV